MSLSSKRRGGGGSSSSSVVGAVATADGDAASTSAAPFTPFPSSALPPLHQHNHSPPPPHTSSDANNALTFPFPRPRPRSETLIDGNLIAVRLTAKFHSLPEPTRETCTDDTADCFVLAQSELASMAATRPPELVQQTPLGNSAGTRAGCCSTSSASLVEGPLTSSSATVAQPLDRGDKADSAVSAATLSMHSEADGIAELPIAGNDEPSATVLGDHDNVRHGDLAVAGGQHKHEQLLASAFDEGSNDGIPAIVPANNSVAKGDDGLQQAFAPSDIGDNRGNKASIAETKRMSDRNYADRFGSYYEYTVATVEGDNKSAPAEPSRADNGQPQRRQRQQNATDVPDRRSPPHGPLPMIPPPLRSTYKSEPMMQGRSDLGDPRNSYSQTLENALFYSQAIRQIRETDCVDSSDPYAVA
ncbi:hypothetical protein GGF42_006335, partial [Coemansia sp. RSA 2424]